MFFNLLGIFILLLLVALFLINRNSPKKGFNTERGSAALNRVIRSGVTDDTLKTINSQLKK